jgi:hypothetical protein
MIVTSMILVVLSAGVIVALFTNSSFPTVAFLQRANPSWIFSGQLVFVSVSQFTRIRNQEYNVDESTWIADALAVNIDTDFFAALLTHTTARPITVLPLLLLDRLGLPISFYTIKVISLLCIILALAFTFLALRNLLTGQLALLCLLPLTAFYTVVTFDDFIAYNSELVCNVFIAAALWLYSLVQRRQERHWQGVIIGLSLGLIPFTKFQAIPSALIIVFFCLYEWYRQNRMASAFLFMATGLMPILVAVLYCLHTDQLTVLIRHYFLYYVNYSYQYSTKPFLERLSPRDILWYYRKQYTFAAYWFGLVAVMAILAWRSRKHGWLARSSFLWLAIILWLVSIYETIQAGTNYEHYLNLVLIPHTFLAAALMKPERTTQLSQRFPRLPAYAYIGASLLIICFIHTKAFERGYNPPLPYDSEVVSIIKRECSPTDRIAIWGWADRYYVLSGIAPGSRYANSVFQMKANNQQAYYLDQYVADLTNNKPRLFIDSVAPEQFTYDDSQQYGHARFSVIDKIISTRYRQIYQRGGLRIYRLVTK